jgi:hypothetical protein
VRTVANWLADAEHGLAAGQPVGGGGLAEARDGCVETAFESRGDRTDRASALVGVSRFSRSISLAMMSKPTITGAVCRMFQKREQTRGASIR